MPYKQKISFMKRLLNFVQNEVLLCGWLCTFADTDKELSPCRHFHFFLHFANLYCWRYLLTIFCLPQGSLPFMEPKQSKGQKAELLKRCCKRVKCFVGEVFIILLQVHIWKNQKTLFFVALVLSSLLFLCLQKRMRVLIQLFLRYNCLSLVLCCLCRAFSLCFLVFCVMLIWCMNCCILGLGRVGGRLSPPWAR